MMNIIGRAKVSKSGKAILLIFSQIPQGATSIPIDQLKEVMGNPNSPLSAEIREYTADHE